MYSNTWGYLTLHYSHWLIIHCDHQVIFLLQSHTFFFISPFNLRSCFFLSHFWPQGLILFDVDAISQDIYKCVYWLPTAKGPLQRSHFPYCEKRCWLHRSRSGVDSRVSPVVGAEIIVRQSTAWVCFFKVGLYSGLGTDPRFARTLETLRYIPPQL